MQDRSSALSNALSGNRMQSNRLETALIPSQSRHQRDQKPEEVESISTEAYAYQTLDERRRKSMMRYWMQF